MAALAEIVAFLDGELRTAEIADHSGAVNGLQLASRGEIRHVAGAVDYSIVVVREAIARGANLIVLHHGMFWSEPAPITGVNYDRMTLLLANDIAVYGSHIPLDLHPRFGNNPLLARELGLRPSGGFAMMRGVAVGVSGESDLPTRELADRAAAFCTRHGHQLVTTPIHPGQVTRRWGICTGAGASSDTLREASQLGLDTIVVGEGPHHTAVAAIDMGITVLYAGHYATETLGVAAIAGEIGRRFGITSSFIEAPTGL
jgi:dinuclear metal center YbgI/SA1388 family protein